MRILVQLEGLLLRFGRVVPDSIAMIEDIRDIDSRLNAAGRESPIDLRLFRVPGDGYSRGVIHQASVNSVNEARILKHYFDLPLEVIDTNDGLQYLIKGGDSHADLVITTNFNVYRYCKDKHVHAIRVGDSGSNDEYFMPYSEVKRALEERLRIPTARPMRASVRTGGLLAIECSNQDAAREQALRFMRKDRNADWIILDDVLLFYTEEPDLEDSLAAKTDVTRLSLAVNKQSLVVDEDGNGQDSGSLFTVGRFSLRQQDSAAIRNATRPQRLFRWDRIRHRQLGGTISVAGNRPKSNSVVMAPLIVPGTDGIDITPLIGTEKSLLPGAISSLISAQLSQDVSADCYYESNGPVAITWMTGSSTGSSDRLVALTYRVPVNTFADKMTLDAMLGIVAINHWLEIIENQTAMFHCLMFDDDLSASNIFKTVLFDDERYRISSIIDFDILLKGKEPLEISDYVDAVEYKTTRIAGGDWCQQPVRADSIHKIQDTLLEILKEQG